ncbi:MAG: HsdR family type I site-specific deoxyribonuclease [Elusimicrobia bacterium]|nr:HsdR family type I site-specific deoxyribonuclease [Elusimicrobiota bacterium]
MPNLDNERLTVQNPIIKYAVDIGWAYLPPDKAVTLRGGESGVFIYETLRNKLIDLNPGIVSIENVDSIIGKIESVRNNIEGNCEILKWLRGEKSIYIESKKQECNIALIDFSNPANNVFCISDEWSFTNGKNRNRSDVMFIINGVPVAIIEAKSAKQDIETAYKQISRYHDETPELLTYAQIFNITHILDFYYGATWNLDRKNLFNWKDEESGNFEKKVKVFFSRQRFLKLLGKWIIFYTKDDELKKTVLRQHQSRAVEKIIERAFDPEKRTGLIWHTQGSGKTFTMIKSAEIILHMPVKPTILMLVDRNELEGQLSGWIVNLLGEDSLKIIESKKELRKILGSGYRGLIVSTIHKFDRADENLSDRKDVFVLIDEAHRSTGANLGNYLIAALPNATFIGFTGTPIDKTAYGKGTFKIFGKEDAKGYLDKYSIAESIEDKTTLPLHYALAPNEIRVSKERLEKEFFSLAETEGISDIEELNKILEKAVSLRNFLKGNERVDKVAKYVAEHFTKNVEPLGYKAFFVAVDREACALYKKALDKYLPPEYSRVVYTKGNNDDKLKKEFYISEDEEKQIRKAFIKSNELPKMLIVTDKLLTGYDAPLLYCMYLDKPMRDHALLQAIARVNRPYEDERGINKSFGFVLDFVGIFERLEKALSFDSDIVSGVIKNIEVLKERFSTLMSEIAPKYLKLCGKGIDDKAVERAIEELAEKDDRGKFFDFYKELEMLYEIISPDIFLRKYINDYSKLAALYQIIRNNFSHRTVVDYKFMRKTESLIREKVSAYMEKPTSKVNLNENIITAIKSSKNIKKAKVINLIIQTIKTIMAEGNQPYLISIKDRAESILDGYENRQISTEDAIKQIEELYRKYQNANKEKQEKGFDENTFAIYWVLKNEDVTDAEKLAMEINETIQKYPHYKDNSEEMRQLKADLYKILIVAAGKDKMVLIVKNILEMAVCLPAA